MKGADLHAPLLSTAPRRSNGMVWLAVELLVLTALVAYLYTYQGGQAWPFCTLRTPRLSPGSRVTLPGGGEVFVRDGGLNSPLVVETIKFYVVAIGVLASYPLLGMMELRASGKRALTAVAMGLRATALTEVVLAAAKNYASVPRPNFYAGCEWSDALHACTAESERQMVFSQSFPSGHAAHAASVATLLTLRLLWHAERAVAESVHCNLLTLAAHLPGPIAVAIAASRVHDRWHHPADVVAGLGLGTAVAALGHRLFVRGEQVVAHA